MPIWNAMSPPELAGDAPIMDVPHPLEIRLGVIFRSERDLAFLCRFNRTIGQWLNFDEPLRREPWFHNSFAAVTLADGQSMVFDARKQAELFQIAQDFLARLIAVQAFISPGILIDARLIVHDVDQI